VQSVLGGLDESLTLKEAAAKGATSIETLIKSVNEAARAGKMSAEEIDALFGAMGYSPEIK
jgi:hypothetical protein